MSYTEHDETMGDLGLEGITASGTAESSPAGASQEASGVERGDPARLVRKHRSKKSQNASGFPAKRRRIPRKIHPAARPLGRPPRRLRRKIPPAAPRMI